MTNFGRSLSSGPLLPQNIRPWVTRMQRKIRAVYEAITCTRTSDVVQQHPSTRHRHHPRPRLEQQPTTTPPPPDQAESSAWQGPTSSFAFQPPQDPWLTIAPPPDQAGSSAWRGPTSSFAFQPPQEQWPTMTPPSYQQGKYLHNFHSNNNSFGIRFFTSTYAPSCRSIRTTAAYVRTGRVFVRILMG